MKYLLILPILICYSTSYSQVYKFKAFQTYLLEPDKKINESAWEKVNFLVIVDLAKNKIKTYGQKKGDYDLIEIHDTYTNQDGNKVMSYEAVDGGGDECNIQITIFNDPDNSHVATLRVNYSFGSIIFRLKKDD